MPIDDLGALIAENFARDMLNSPILTAIFMAVMQGHLDDPRLDDKLEGMLKQAGYDPCSLEDVSAAVERLRSREPSVWHGIYTLYGPHNIPGPRLAITQDNAILLNGHYLTGASYADDRLVWTNDSTTTSSACLLFHSPDPEHPLAGPSITGTFTYGQCYEVTGRYNVFSTAASEGHGDPASFWSGIYELHYADSQPTVLLLLEADAEDGYMRVCVDGTTITSPNFENNILSWQLQGNNPSGAALLLTCHPVTGEALCLGRYWTNDQEPLLHNCQGTSQPVRPVVLLTTTGSDSASSSDLATWKGTYDLSVHVSTGTETDHLYIGNANETNQVRFDSFPIVGWDFTDATLSWPNDAQNSNVCRAKLTFNTQANDGSKGCYGSVWFPDGSSDLRVEGKQEPPPPYTPDQSTSYSLYYGSSVTGAVSAAVIGVALAGMVKLYLWWQRKRSGDPLEPDRAYLEAQAAIEMKVLTDWQEKQSTIDLKPLETTPSEIEKQLEKMRGEIQNRAEKAKEQEHKLIETQAQMQREVQAHLEAQQRSQKEVESLKEQLQDRKGKSEQFIESLMRKLEHGNEQVDLEHKKYIEVQEDLRKLEGEMKRIREERQWAEKKEKMTQKSDKLLRHSW